MEWINEIIGIWCKRLVMLDHKNGTEKPVIQPTIGIALQEIQHYVLAESDFFIHLGLSHCYWIYASMPLKGSGVHFLGGLCDQFQVFFLKMEVGTDLNTWRQVQMWYCLHTLSFYHGICSFFQPAVILSTQSVPALCQKINAASASSVPIDCRRTTKIAMLTQQSNQSQGAPMTEIAHPWQQSQR